MTEPVLINVTIGKPSAKKKKSERVYREEITPIDLPPKEEKDGKND